MHRLVLDDGQVVSGRTVLIATGATYQRLPVAGCERWDGAGIFYSCTSVHARSCKDGRAAVVGGGNSAGQAAMFLAEHTAGATLLLRGGDLRKSMSDYLARRIERHEKIEVIRHVEVDAVEGDRTLTGLRLRDVRDGGTRDLDCSAVFVFIGAQPRTDWLPPSIAVDPKGFILTGADAAQSDRWPLTDREPCTVETTCPGVFAAGDVRSNTTKRVAFAVGDGALAVTCAHRVLAELDPVGAGPRPAPVVIRRSSTPRGTLLTSVPRRGRRGCPPGRSRCRRTPASRWYWRSGTTS